VSIAQALNWIIYTQSYETYHASSTMTYCKQTDTSCGVIRLKCIYRVRH